MDKARAWWSEQKPIEKAVAVLGALLLVVVALSFASSQSGQAKPDDLTNDARVACHAQVESRLKAPSTAEINDADEAGGPQGPWTFRGTVDAENSFGAKIRSGWTCRIARTDQGWDVQSVTVQ